ncbi:MAG: hypothetical protein RLZZ308_145 [Candidatus Parcubacteria bacterium]|jgi:hypothetical protein
MKIFFLISLCSTLILFWVFGETPVVGGVFHSLGKEVYTQSNDEGLIASSTTQESVHSLSASTSTSSATQTVIHEKTPQNVKALYMSSWVASAPTIRTRIVDMIDTTELNAVVIDVKDNTGVVTWNGRMKEQDLKEFIETLHTKGIYVIGRIAVFQDPRYALQHKDQSVQRVDGSIWKSRKGEMWVDTGSRSMWAYTLLLGEQAYEYGFDEINLDYIRFSTEGYRDSLVFPVSGTRAKTDRVGVVSEFYSYITKEFQERGIPVSGDVFGIITTSTADIPVLGQDLHEALRYFDYVAPMVYPSHYAPGTFGVANPAANPELVIREAMKGALIIADEVASSTGQATSSIRAKLRPWYQDFDMGATYTKEMVRGQITQGENLGVSSWMLWDPSNKYTPSALSKE